MTTARYPYVKSRTQRILRELAKMENDLGVLLRRLESPLIETARGQLNPDTKAENKMYVLRSRIRDAIMHLTMGIEE